MKRISQIQVLGDSILKGVQVDHDTGRYVVHNEIDVPALEEEFGLSVQNSSRFGATCLNGQRLLDRLVKHGLSCDAVVMDFGGNDCDYQWEEIAREPQKAHSPKVPLPQFQEQYRALIRRVKDLGMVPILTTLPPLVPQRFFSWWCRDLDQDTVRQWLGSDCNIYAHQERYSRAVTRLAWEEDAPLVDIRGAFLEEGRIDDLLCEDGTHPNSRGQALITQAFRDFGSSWRSQRCAALS